MAGETSKNTDHVKGKCSEAGDVASGNDAGQGLHGRKHFKPMYKEARSKEESIKDRDLERPHNAEERKTGKYQAANEDEIEHFGHK